MHSLYLGITQWKNPTSHSDRQIFIIGFEPSRDVFDFPGINANLGEIAEPGNIAFDEGSRPEFGAVGEMLRKSGSVATELGHRHVEVVALFRAGANFANDGNVISSDTTFLHLFPQRRSGWWI